MGELRFESFEVAGEPGAVDPRGAAFIAQIDYGFLTAPRDGALVTAQLDRFRADHTLLTVAFDDDQDPRGVPADQPVATFADFPGTVCVADGVVIPARMITEVSVRATHRRRGILSTMMTGALQRAQDAGVALALLTATEGGIYGRFGFGLGASACHVNVAVPRGLKLRGDVAEALADAGLQVIIPTWAAMPAIHDAVFGVFQQRTPGQVGSTHAFRRRIAGERNAWAQARADCALRALAVLGPGGEPRGYALAEPKDEGDGALVVHELAGADPLAEIALWEALGATDLVAELRYHRAPVDFALPAALANPRDVTFVRRDDTLWIRILDVPAAISARGLRADGAFRLRVLDAHGLASGSWNVRRIDGVTTVEPGADESLPMLRLDVEALGQLLLGATRVTALVGAGRAEATDLDTIALLLGPTRSPRNTYGF